MDGKIAVEIKKGRKILYRELPLEMIHINPGGKDQIFSLVRNLVCFLSLKIGGLRQCLIFKKVKLFLDWVMS